MPEEVETFFNNVIKVLARFGVFPKEIAAILVGSGIQTPEKYKGCGRASRIKTIDGKEVKVTVFGFKIMAVMDLYTKIPLAVKVVKINEREPDKNHAPCLRPRLLDGQDLYAIDRMGIIFIILAKGNMTVYRDARDLAYNGNAGNYRERNDLIAIGIEGLTTFDAYCPVERLRHKYLKNFIPKPINAVVVHRWGNIGYSAENGPVLLTNGPVSNPLEVLDRYDDRSIIENLLFRETKQGWHLNHPPKKSEAAMVSHVVLTMVTYALVMAYRGFEEDDDIKNSKRHRSFKNGTRRWKRKEQRDYRDHVIIFKGEYYGIFHVEELAILSGIKVKQSELSIKSKEQIYKKRGINPPIGD